MGMMGALGEGWRWAEMAEYDDAGRIGIDDDDDDGTAGG
jgi:hypothetical protein